MENFRNQASCLCCSTKFCVGCPVFVSLPLLNASSHDAALLLIAPPLPSECYSMHCCDVQATWFIDENIVAQELSFPVSLAFTLPLFSSVGIDRPLHSLFRLEFCRELLHEFGSLLSEPHSMSTLGVPLAFHFAAQKSFEQRALQPLFVRTAEELNTLLVQSFPASTTASASGLPAAAAHSSNPPALTPSVLSYLCAVLGVLVQILVDSTESSNTRRLETEKKLAEQ